LSDDETNVVEKRKFKITRIAYFRKLSKAMD
jgi:hypothetical protein